MSIKLFMSWQDGTAALSPGAFDGANGEGPVEIDRDGPSGNPHDPNPKGFSTCPTAVSVGASFSFTVYESIPSTGTTMTNLVYHVKVPTGSGQPPVVLVAFDSTRFVIRSGPTSAAGVIASGTQVAEMYLFPTATGDQSLAPGSTASVDVPAGLGMTPGTMQIQFSLLSSEYDEVVGYSPVVTVAT